MKRWWTITLAGLTLPLVVSVQAIAEGDHTPAAAPVAPSLEIQVLDPRADPLGNPTVELDFAESYDRLHVEIPPVVMVLKYFYTGDRSFQAAMLPGGPSILVFNHPQTGERQYLQANLPPGAPRVTYNFRFIEFDYGFQSVTISFKHNCLPIVTYRQGESRPERLRERTADLVQAPGRWFRRTNVPEYGQVAGQATRNAVASTGDQIGELTSTAAEPIAGTIRSTPLGSLFSRPAPAPEKISHAERRRAAREPVVPRTSILSLEGTAPLFP